MKFARLLPFVAVAFALAASSACAASPVPASSYDALHWRNIGPFLGGRSLAVAGVPGKPLTFYAGFTGGGVWKTTNAGKSWINISGQMLETGSVGALAVAPSDPNVIYVGMGEPAIRGDMATGDGVYKSSDGGKTWTHAGLGKTHVIGDIVIDPRNAEHVYVAALGHVFGPNKERGVYETTDGGKHWEKILYVDEKTGAVDLAMVPANPRVLYAAMWQAFRRPWMLSSGGPGSGLYKSTDGGAHWTNISRHPGLPKGLLGKIGITVSPADPNRLYAIIEAEAGGVFRSDDAGATWKRVYGQSHLRQRAWYFSRMYADPQNVDTVYAPQVAGVFKSTDGGEQFTPLHLPHGDVHDLWINPKQPRIMIAGTDGGAAVTQDGGKSWSTLRNQPTGQFYHVALDDAFPFHVYGAQQDRGSIALANRSSGFGITAADMHSVAGGESGYVVPVPGKPWITYGGGYGGLLERSNARTGQSMLVGAWPDNPMGHGAKDLKYRFQWTYPILISKFPPHAIYIGAQYVLRSTDRGKSWTRISPDLTRDIESKQVASGGPITKDNTSVEYYGTVFALVQSPLDKDVLWAGSDDGLVHVTTDGGKHWQDVTPGGLPKLSTISIIEPSHFDAGTAYLAARRYRMDDFEPYLYKTTDYGGSWTKITNGLPQDESSFVIRQDTEAKNLLFAGTLGGVYVSFDDGGQWQPLQLDLPHVPVRDMRIHPRASALVLATHGLGFQVLDNLEPLREMNAGIADAVQYLFTPEPAYLTTGFSFSRPGVAVGENPPNGVVVFYELAKAPPEDEKVSLTFATAAGTTIASFSNQTDAQGKPLEKDQDFYPPREPKQKGVVPAEAGMNRFVWNLRVPDATAVPGAVLWFGSMRGPHVVPGSYRVTLAVGDAETTRAFTVRKTPVTAATQADLEAQFALAMKIHHKLDATDKAILKLRKARKAVKGYLDRLEGKANAGTVEKAARPIVATLTEIEYALMQTKSHAPEDPLNYPIRLNNKLAALALVVQAGYTRPSRQAYAVFAELSAKVDAQLQKLHHVLDVELPNLNALIRQAGIAPIAVPRPGGQAPAGS
ncbi:MAG: glycosyl hydrolase [Gammaproteobacteria bacterium]|nr:glycosyl hydrolase [Gammaproteobacteria bacterium]